MVCLVGRVGDALRRKALFRAFVITATPHTVRICAAAAFRQVGESLAEATDNADIRDSGLPPLEGRRRGHFRTMLQLAELGVSRLEIGGQRLQPTVETDFCSLAISCLKCRSITDENGITVVTCDRPFEIIVVIVIIGAMVPCSTRRCARARVGGS